jgi:hypothetical protein
VAIHTLISFVFMLARIDRKILLVMVETEGLPGGFGMAIRTGGPEARGIVFWIIRSTIISLVAGYQVFKTGESTSY